LVDFTVPAEVFIYILDLFGTMAFAVTGAFKAIENKADIVGIVICSFCIQNSKSTGMFF
jgi:uncharacterized membrane protein YeiH